jgi:gliding motility-associated-like protein
LVLGLFSPDTAKASHALGADMNYVCIDAATNTYKFFATFYRDCGGIAAPPTIDFNFENVCGLTPSMIPATFDTLFNGVQELYSGLEVSPLCPDDLINSECNGGSLPGVEVYVYSAIVTLPYDCPEWTVGFSVNARNTDIDNLVTPGAQNLYVEAKVNNMGSICNNSPLFTQLPVAYICRNTPFNFNHSAVDVDGDSLVYELIQPLDGPGAPIPYVTPPYSLALPLTTTSGTFPFDTQTGQMSFTPDAEQTGVVTVLVNEYRDGVWIGSTMRDIQIIVASCSNISPADLGGVDSLVGGSAPDQNSVVTCPGDSLLFQIAFGDGDSDDTLTLSTNIGLTIPGATFTWSGTNPIVATFSWNPEEADTGYYIFTVTVSDDACPLPSVAAFAYDITILGDSLESFAVGDATICPGEGTPFDVTGAIAFAWTPPIGLSCTDCPNPTASPPASTTYQVVAVRPSGCVDTHFVDVVVDDIPDVDAGPDRVIDPAISTNTQLFGSSTTATSFSWAPPVGLSNTAIAQPLAFPLNTTTYVLTVANATGCLNSDTATVEVLPLTQAAFPNAFTPNSDGLNDVFRPVLNNPLPIIDASIYNRWGERVWYSTERGAGWDGTWMGKDQEAGTYIVVIRFQGLDGKPLRHTGTTTLLR